jgi:DNA-binding transcriptional LysR family regulator
MVTWSRLAKERWVLAARSALIRNVIEGNFLREGLIPPEPVVESTSPVTNVKLVAAGLGLSAVPASSMREAERSGEVKRIRVHPPIAPTAVGLIYRDSAASHPRVALLREALSKH